MSAELRAQLDVERRQLRRLLDTHSALLAKCRGASPAIDERAAAAAILHAFYTGVENIFKRVAVVLDGGLPSGPN